MTKLLAVLLLTTGLLHTNLSAQTYVRALGSELNVAQFPQAANVRPSGELLPVAQKPDIDSNWVRDQQPFRIAGNLYYVGTYDLASYLISTSKGLILINTGIEGSDTMIRRHIEALGFQFPNIRILLATHAHFDHVGAMAALKKATNAKLMIHKKDAPLLADGGSSDYILGGHGPMFTPVKADRQLQDHDLVTLGDMQIMVLHHPGHTKGACSFLFSVKDNDREYRVLIANMPSILDATKFPSMPNYPAVGKDYAYTLDAMPKIQFDIWLASHASQFNLHKKHMPGDPYNPEAFAGRKGYDEALENIYKIFREK